MDWNSCTSPEPSGDHALAEISWLLLGTAYNISLMKDQLQRIIDNMQAEIKNEASAQTNWEQGYIAACKDYIQDLQELMEMLESC